MRRLDEEVIQTSSREGSAGGGSRIGSIERRGCWMMIWGVGVVVECKEMVQDMAAGVVRQLRILLQRNQSGGINSGLAALSLK